MINKRQIQQQQKIKDHLQDLLNIDHGLSDSQVKWIEIYNKILIAGENFTTREAEVIYDIHDQALNKDLL